MSDSTRRTVRTVFQCLVGLAAGLPVLIAASGVPENAAGIGVVLAVSAFVTRMMASPVVQSVLPRWLRAEEPEKRTDVPRPDGRPE